MNESRDKAPRTALVLIETSSPRSSPRARPASAQAPLRAAAAPDAAESVRATIQDAFAGGYELLVCRDATNSNRPHLAAASLEDIDRCFGRVVDLSEALEAL